MKHPRLILIVPLLTLGAACGGSSFTSEGGSGDDGSSSGGDGSNSSSSSDSGSADSNSTSDGSSTSTRSTSSTGTSGSTGGSGGTAGAGGTAGGSGNGGTAGSGGASGGTGGSGNSTIGSGGSGGSMVGCPLSCELAEDSNGNELCSCKRPEVECETDADCVLANNLGVCCSGCSDAWPADLVESEPCLVTAPDWSDADCETPDCTQTVCPAIACEQVRYATCEDHRCVGMYECPDGMVFDHGHCVSMCEENDECVIAWNAGSCCGGCPIPVHRQVLEEDPCMVPYGQEAPEECAPNPADCALVGCPDVLCLEPGAAVCAEGGVCGSSTLL